MGLRDAILSHNFGWQLGGVGFASGLTFGIILFIAFLWTLFWKYKALWHAAKHEHKIWFVILLIVNTLGILEILYLYVFSKYHKN